MSNPCRFCGATDRKITNEHVWPEWLDDVLPAMPVLGHSERWSGGGRQRWREPFLSSTVRAFCDNCNSGWMSELEEAAKAIVEPMVTGVRTTLDSAARQRVANWAVLKGLVAVQTSPTPQPVPERHYCRVYSAKGAPANTVRVWIGQRRNLIDPGRPDRAKLFDSHFLPVTNVARQFPLPRDFARYIDEGGVFNATIFQIGHFLALTLQHDWPGLQVRPELESDAEHAFLSIWPARADVRWPPPRPVDALGNAHRVTELFEMAPPTMPVVGR